MGVLAEVIGRHVRRLRKQHHWTQAELAEQVNMSLDMIGRVERGQATPSLATIEMLSQIFKVPPAGLMIDDLVPHSDSQTRQRSYTKLCDLLSTLDDSELDWVYRVVEIVINRHPPVSAS